MKQASTRGCSSTRSRAGSVDRVDETEELEAALLQEVEGLQRVLLGVDAEEVTDGTTEPVRVFRRLVWSDPCVFCRRDVLRRTWIQLVSGRKARVPLVRPKLSTTCAGCARDIWEMTRR